MKKVLSVFILLSVSLTASAQTDGSLNIDDYKSITNLDARVCFNGNVLLRADRDHTTIGTTSDVRCSVLHSVSEDERVIEAPACFTIDYSKFQYDRDNYDREGHLFNIKREDKKPSAITGLVCRSTHLKDRDVVVSSMKRALKEANAILKGKDPKKVTAQPKSQDVPVFVIRPTTESQDQHF